MAKKQTPRVVRVRRAEIVAIRRALANYIGLMDAGMLEGQQDPDNTQWNERYVEQEKRRCRTLLDEQFRVTW